MWPYIRHGLHVLYGLCEEVGESNLSIVIQRWVDLRLQLLQLLLMLHGRKGGRNRGKERGREVGREGEKGGREGGREGEGGMLLLMYEGFHLLHLLRTDFQHLLSAPGQLRFEPCVTDHMTIT